jgi:hypothetical protein
VKKAIKSSKRNKFPKGWNEGKVRRVISHFENQTPQEAAADDDKIFNGAQCTYMRIPVKLVPAVRKLLVKRAG